MKAMVFAAGEGTRLRPLTLTRPKALVEVGGKPMLARVLDALRRAGVTEAVVNVHYLGQMIADYIAANNFGMKIHIADESSRLLETGGGLLAARTLLEGNEPILLHNADICTDLDLSQLRLQGDATLVVSNRPSSRKLVFNPADMRLQGWVNEQSGQTKGNANGLRVAFNGIHIVSPRIFSHLTEYADKIGSDIFSLTPFYVDMAAKLNIRGIIPGSYRWHDVGDATKLAAANAAFSV